MNNAKSAPGPSLFRLLSRMIVAGASAAALRAAEVPLPPGNEPALRMAPFKVAAQWIEIQPLLVNGIIDYVRVVHVQKSSPAAAAGVREGMHIVEIQGIRVPGLTEVEFGRQLESLPPADRLTLKVRGIVQTTDLVVSFPHPGETTSPRTPLETARSPTGSSEGSVPVTMTEAEARKHLDSIRRALEREVARISVEARKTGSARMDSSVQTEATREAGIIAASHLALVCQAIVDAEGNTSRADTPLRGALTMALRQPRDYPPEQKAAVLKFLPRLPYLINIVERMQWFDGAEAAIAAGWKKARGDMREGMLTPDSSRYAIIAARNGVTDALVAIARTVLDPRADTRSRGRLLQEEAAALSALVPLSGDTPAAQAEFVKKNSARLVFDRNQKIYVLAPGK